MKTSTAIVLLFFLATLVPNSIADGDIISVDKVAAEGYVAYVVNESDNTNTDETDDKGPNPDVKKCPCKGTGWIENVDGNKSECPYHYKDSGSQPTVNTDKKHCECETETTVCNCIATYGKCYCAKKAKQLPADRERIELDIKKKLESRSQEETFTNTAPPAGKQILFFTANWCPPCQTFKQNHLPLLQKVGWDARHNRDAMIRIVDIDTEPDVYYRLGLGRSIPLFVMTVDGEEVDSITGCQSIVRDGVEIPPETQITDMWYKYED